MEPAEPVAAPPADPRGERRPRDMALSLAVLLIPIALLLVFYRFVLNGDAPVTIDAGPVIQEASAAAVFPVAVPGDLGEDWHVSSATFKRQADGATLRLGYVDPDDDPVQLIESSVPAATLLPIELGTTAKPSGQFRAADRAWRVYDARPGEHALVLTEPNRTIVVIGTTDTRNLRTLATSLS